MLVLDAINKAIKSLDEAVEKIYVCDKRWSIEFEDEMPNIIKLLEIFYNLVPILNSIGVEFDRSILSNQLNEFEEYLKCNDFMRVADVLRYEIKESMLVFKELIDAGVIRNEELL